MGKDRSSAFLDGLPSDDLAAVKRLLRPTVLTRGMVLNGGEADSSYVLIVGSGLLRLSLPLADGRSTALGLVGAGSLIGASAALDRGSIEEEATVLVAGSGWKISARAFGDLVRQRPSLAAILLNSLVDRIARLQIELTCAAHHSVDRRLARTLLYAFHKTGLSSLAIKQDDLALTLGMQRTTICEAAARLRARGAISYLRGVIRIADEDQLRRLGCGCTKAIGPGGLAGKAA